MTLSRDLKGDLERDRRKTSPFTIPEKCPFCGSKVVRKKTERIYAVQEATALPNPSKVIYFASKDAMNIEGLGPSSVEALMSHGYVENAADLYSLHKYREELVEKGIVGKEKGTDNLLQAIESSKGNDIDRLITGLGIRNVGRQAARVLAGNFPDMDAIKNATYEQLIVLPDFGEIMVRDILEFMAREETAYMLTR